MRTAKLCMTLALVFALHVCLTACSKETPPATESKTAPAPQPSAPAPQPSAPAPAPTPAAPAASPSPTATTEAKVNGMPTTEKYRLSITNYTHAAVTASVNGDWIGQWDSNADVPLEAAVQGKNTLTLELQTEPKGDLTVTIYTSRNGQNVSLVSSNLNGKSGTLTYAFVGK